MGARNPNRDQDPVEFARELSQESGQPKRLKKSQFTLTNGTANERSLIAEFSAPYPLALRQDPIRMMFVYHEAFFHDGATTTQQTYSLSLDALDTNNTNAFLLYSDSGRVQPDSVDHANDQFTYSESADVTLHAFYVARDPLQVEVWKEKPGTVGNVGEQLYDDVTADLHSRNQNEQAPVPTFRRSPLQPVIPQDWKLRVYAEGSAYGVDWDDADTDTSGSKTVNDVTATNAIIDIPIRQTGDSVPGLDRAVTDDIGGRL